jgi:hypothetical protein
MSGATRIRLLAIGILVVVLVPVGALLSIPWLIRDPLPVLRPDTRIAFPAEADPERVAAQLHVNAAGDFVLLFAWASAEEQAASPRVVFEMPDHAMPAIEPDVHPVGAGGFRATGRLGMPGRWQFRILENTDPQIFDFILAEF